MVGVISEKERTILLGTLEVGYFLFLRKDEKNQNCSTAEDRRQESQLRRAPDSLDLRALLNAAVSCYRRTDDPKTDTEPILSEFSQIYWKDNFFLQEIRIQDDIAVLLFDFINPEGAPMAYKGQTDRRMRVIRKNPGEGADYSAHLVINLNGHNGKYSAALEQMPGIPPSIADKLLSQLNICIRKYNSALFYVDDPSGVEENGQIRCRRIRTQLTFGLTPSDQLWSCLTHRENLCEIVLKKEQSTNFDEEAHWQTKKTDVYLAIPGDEFFIHPRDAIRDLCRVARVQEFRNLNLRIKDQEKQQRVVTIDVNSLAEKTRRFVKSERIELRTPVSTGYAQINDEVVRKMQFIL